jgi:hypothetical protein
MKATEQIRQIGMWMDHASAKLVHSDGRIEEIHSNHISLERLDGESGDGTKLGNYRSTNNEAHKHNKEVNELHSYFNSLYEALAPFSEILIFGPSTAHDEFANYIIDKHKHFPGKIALAKTDYMTGNQLVEYVRNYYKTTSN